MSSYRGWRNNIQKLNSRILNLGNVNHVIDSIKLTEIGSTVEVKEVDEKNEGRLLFEENMVVH